MTIIEQERKERLQEILRQIDFLLENDETLPTLVASDLCYARSYVASANEREASNGQS